MYAHLRDVASRLTLPADVLVIEDDEPGPAIAAMAALDTLVCMATHARTGVRRAVLGRVTEAVLRHVSGPMLLTGPFAWRQRSMVGGNLLVCLDGSERAEPILPARRFLIAAGTMPDESKVAARLAAVSPDTVETWTVPDAGHTDDLDTDAAEWERRVVGFLDDGLGSGP